MLAAREKEVLHQISTPLTSALLGLEDLQNKKRLPRRELKSIINEIKKVARTLQTRDALERERQRFVPAQEIEQLLQAYRKPYQVECRFQKPSQEITVFGQPQAFSTIVTHLLNNAAEAYPQLKPRREISIELVPAMKGMNLIIGDNGQGIAWWRKWLLKIRGVSFKQIKSGLGLGQVRKIVKKEFGGATKIVSLPGKGTLVIVHFPL